MILEIILTGLLIMIASLIGAIFVWRGLGTWMQRNLQYLISFSAGVFLVITYGLIEEVVHLEVPSAYIVLSMVGSMIVLEGASRLIPDLHHHHDAKQDHQHSRIDARRVLLGDAIHNIGDGILLVPAFLLDLHVGIATGVAILLHELVQEISEFFVLREAGYSNTQALIRNFLISGTIFIGIGLSAVLSSVESLVGPLIAFSAGGFLYIILRDLLPNTIQCVRKHNRVGIHILAALIGIGLMFGVVSLVPHTHEHDEEHHHESIEALHEEGHV